LGSETYYTATAIGNPRNQTTLPIELISFTGIVKGNSVNLNWQTATEVSNYGFNVERRTKSKGWETLGFVQGRNLQIRVRQKYFCVSYHTQ